MLLSAKCGFDKNQLKESLKKGLPYLEFHSNFNDFNGSTDFYEIRKILNKSSVQCLTVHCPIKDRDGAINTISIPTLQDEQREYNMNLFKTVIAAANILCSDSPRVVIHVGTGYALHDASKNSLSPQDIDNYLRIAHTDLKELQDFITTYYPSTIICIENMMNLVCSSDTVYSWYFGTNTDLSDFIRRINLPNVKCCLDICHTLGNIRAQKCIDPFYSKTITDVLSSYSDVLGLIHFNNSINLGEQNKNHSAPFYCDNPEDILLVTDLLKAICNLNINCPITLEILEEDYNLQGNISKTIDTIVTVNKDLKIKSLDDTLSRRGIITT